MNEMIRTCHWADIVSCPLFANVFKKNITSSVIHIFLLKIEWRMNRHL